MSLLLFCVSLITLTSEINSTEYGYISKEFEKLSKYKNLEMKIEKMWKLKTIIVPVIVDVLGMIKKGSQKHIEKSLEILA